MIAGKFQYQCRDSCSEFCDDKESYLSDNASIECSLQVTEKIPYFTVMPWLNLQDKGFLFCFTKWNVNFTTAALEG